MQNKSTRKKSAKISVLMIMSMVLLSSFLGYWLKTQYDAGKTGLRKDLENILTRSVNDVTDSLLLGEVIKPILAENNKFKFKVHMRQSDSGKIGAFMKEEKVIINLTGDDSLLRQELPQRFIRASKNREKGIGDTIYDIRDTAFISNLGAIQRGVRVLIKQLDIDSSGPMNIDSNNLRVDFINKLHKEDLDFKVGWSKGNTLDEGIVIQETLPGMRISMLIQGYQSYLLRNITPQILFALLLLTIIASAFLTMYRGFIAQQKLNMMKNDLVSNMTHELKTPIATVKVALEALDNFQVINDPQTSKEYLKMAVSEMDRLELLVNQALNTSLLESGNMNLHLSQHDLSSIVSQTVHAMQIRIDQSQGKVNIQNVGDYFILNVDRLHIPGVLINLLDNSIKYADKPLEMTITLTEEKDRMLITVKDNGPGIPERFIGRVFDKFFRVPTGAIHNTRGYGLGLSYAWQVIRQHKGSISVTNNPGEGCTFTIALPKLQ